MQAIVELEEKKRKIKTQEATGQWPKNIKQVDQRQTSSCSEGVR